MAPIVSTIEIRRTPDEVFPYVIDPSRFAEWQESAISGSTEGGEGVGSRCIVTRKLGGAERTLTSEVTEYAPPRRWAIHGIDGPVRADVDVSVEPVPGDSTDRSRVTVRMTFHGHGFGKLIAPLAASQARKEVVASCQTLKERLEQGA